MIPPTIARELVRNIGKFMSEITAGALTAIGGVVAKIIKAVKSLAEGMQK
jgi:hypothetical protein